MMTTIRIALIRRLFGLLALTAAMLPLSVLGAGGDSYRLQSGSPAGAYDIDPLHSAVFFTVGHLGVSEFQGRFNKISGTFTLNPSRPEQSRIEVEVPISSLDTGYAPRNKDLLGPDFFNAKQFPVMRFVGKKYQPKKGGRALLAGDLTLHGVTRPVTFEVRHIGSGPDPWGGYRTGYTASATIKRNDFGMSYMLGGISDEVRITVYIEGKRK